MSAGLVPVGRCLVDVQTGRVHRDGQEVRLTQVERRLLVELARRAPAVVSRDELHQILWPAGLPSGSRALDQVWSRLRRSLGSASDGRLATVRGRGLAIVPGSAEPVAEREPSRIPTFSTAFIGYGEELRAILDWIRETPSGWLTLTGIGGAGKTRLAAEAAHQAADPTSTWVDLAPLTDGPTPLLQVARRLGVDPAPGDGLDAALANALERRRALLFLDNLEHLPEASQRLAAVLASCPGVRVVATSRRRLDVPGERRMELRGLHLHEAPDLFSELLRQRMVGAEVEVDPQVIEAVCAAARGHPLTLELAVATLRRRPASAMLKMLRAAPTRLRGEKVGRQPRHRSFEATFDYSWALLTPSAQRALAALSLFVGPFDRVLAGELLDVHSDEIDALQDQSLLHETSGQLHLHPLIREAGRERLAHLDPEDGVGARFRARLLGWLADRRQEIRTESNPSVATHVGARLPDLSAAWHGAVAAGELESIATAWPAARAWIAYRDDHSTGAAWCEAALTVVHDPDLRVDLLATLGHCLVPLGEAPRAIARMSSAVDTRSGAGADSLVRLHLALAGAHARLGAGEQADRALERAQDLAVGLDDDDLHAWLHLQHGMRLRAAGQSHLTGPPSVGALRHARASGNRPLLRRALVLRGSYLIARSRFTEALEHAQEARTLAEAAQDKVGLCSAMNIEALGLRYLGRLEEALTAFEATRVMLEARGAVANLPYTHNQIANVHMEMGQLDLAVREATRARDLAESRGDRKDVSFALLTLANTHLAVGDYQAGRAAAERRRAFETGAGGPANLASASMTGIALCLLAHLAGDDARAKLELQRTQDLFPGDPPYLRLQIAIVEALVASRERDAERASGAVGIALQLSREAGTTTLRRTLYALALALADLGWTDSAAAVRGVLDSGPVLVERWVFGSHLPPAAEGGGATLADAERRVASHFGPVQISSTQ